MEFCPRCGAVMFPAKGKFSCQCGYEKNITDKLKDKYNFSEEVESKDNVIFTGDDVSTLPTTRVECPKCGNMEAFWWLQQTRRADESETRFFRCTRCKHTWREYD